MDLLHDDIRTLYRKYSATSIFGALVMSIYSFVDTIAVGQSEGPVGAAAMAVITPLYGILIFIAVLCGVGASVMMSNARGAGNYKKGNAYFTASVFLSATVIMATWISAALFHREILFFFGADKNIMPKVMEYARWIIWFLPIFIAPTIIASFLRNDGNPELAMRAVIIGGCVNIFGDWFFVFALGLRMTGAAIATVIGTTLQVIIMCSHFFAKRCHLRLVKFDRIPQTFGEILSVGFGASVLDLGTVVLSIFMNNQIMRYGDTTQLAVYGVASTIASLFQALFCGIGQAIQPIVSANLGAGQSKRIKQVWKLSLITVTFMGVLFTMTGELFPQQIMRLFVDVTPSSLLAAPRIMRPYFTFFLFLGITVLSTYYLQAVIHRRMSITIALLRSVVISGFLLDLLQNLVETPKNLTLTSKR